MAYIPYPKGIGVLRHFYKTIKYQASSIFTQNILSTFHLQIFYYAEAFDQSPTILNMQP